MARPVVQVIQDVLKHFPKANRQVIFSCLEQVHIDLCNEWNIYTDRRTINEVANQQTYPIDEDIDSILAAYHVFGSGPYDFTQLDPVDTGDMDREDAGWRRSPGNNPTSFALEGGNIVLIPTPLTSTVGSYPRLEIDITKRVDLTLTGTLPAAIPDNRIWEIGACRYLAEREDKEQLEIYSALYEQEKNNLERRLGRRNRNLRRRIYPDAGYAVPQI